MLGYVHGSIDLLFRFGSLCFQSIDHRHIWSPHKPFFTCMHMYVHHVHVCTYIYIYVCMQLLLKSIAVRVLAGGERAHASR